MPSSRRPMPRLAVLPPASEKPTSGTFTSNRSTLVEEGGAPLLNSRQEAFCRAYVLGSEAYKAAYAAGYAARSAHNQAHRLLQRPAVKQRIRYLRGAVAEQACQDTASLIAKLEAVYHRAINLGQYGAANRAVVLQAQLAGLDRILPRPERGPELQEKIENE